MKLIKLNGIEYKTKSKLTIFVDTVSMLPYSFVTDRVINANEWASNFETIVKRFNLDITEINIDGRKKEYKKLPYFTWGILKSSKQ